MPLSHKEKQILKSIKVASENNPVNPKFPPHAPKFPATPTYKIKVPGFSNVWLKDESKNPTGTHKDRMAWEIIVTYRDFLLAKERSQVKATIPVMSIISSGSAATAIQTLLKKYKLPNLKVLLDYRLDRAIAASLKKLGCELYETDLDKQEYSWKEIITLTNNRKGFDITSTEALDPTTRFYDWLSYEIINTSPDYCFIPFGTGNLFENILNINKKEVSTKNHDPRFKGNVNKLRACNFIGVTTNNPGSQATKLFSPHLPFANYNEQWIRLYRQAGFCDSESSVCLLQEKYLKKAITLATELKIDAEPSGISGLALMLQSQIILPRNKKMLIVNTGKTKFV